jgi:uncharacterized protein
MAFSSACPELAAGRLFFSARQKGNTMPGQARHGRRGFRWLLRLAALLLALLGAAATAAPTFPPLTGRVVDAAHVLPADVAARLDQQLAALETQSQRQLVVATIPDLQGYDIEDYGYRLGRAWGLGDKKRNDGIVLIIAPHERKVRIEVGYGLEATVTDGLSELIIQNVILPRFRAGDMPGGIEAGTTALIRQLTLPTDQAQKIAATAHSAPPQSSGQVGPSLLWLGFIALFFIWPMFRRMRGGQPYGSGLGPVLLWGAMEGMGGGRSEGGGFGGGGGGFSGGGGSFGGGGASGNW